MEVVWWFRIHCSAGEGECCEGHCCECEHSACEVGREFGAKWCESGFGEVEHKFGVRWFRILCEVMRFGGRSAET